MNPDPQDLSDYAVPQAPPKPKPSTLPPAAKTVREIGSTIRDIAYPLMALLAAKWGYDKDGHLFAFALGGVIVGNYALRKADGMPDVGALVQYFLGMWRGR